MWKQINSDGFKNKINNKLLFYQSYVPPFNSLQTNELCLV